MPGHSGRRGIQITSGPILIQLQFQECDRSLGITVVVENRSPMSVLEGGLGRRTSKLPGVAENHMLEHVIVEGRDHRVEPLHPVVQGWHNPTIR